MLKRIISFLPGFALSAIWAGLDMLGIQDPALGRLLLIAGITGLILPAAYWLYQFKKRSQPELALDKDITKQRALTETLGQYTNEHTNVKISFASLREKELAETLISIFELAGWKVNLISLPLEPYTHHFYNKTEVRGFNKHLVEAVALALTNAGIIRITSKVDELKVKPENPKWPHSKHKIYIVVGHQD